MNENKRESVKPLPDLDILKYKGTPENPDIKIFVSDRIDQVSEQIDNPLFIPVRCGAAFDNRDPEEYDNILGDDTGDNISKYKLNLSEYTVQYWAWKNIKADYYGLCHYRRYLSFTGKNQKEFKYNENNHICENSFSSKVIEAHNLNSDKYMSSIISQYDIIYGVGFKVKNKKFGTSYYHNVYSHWNALFEEFHLSKINIFAVLDKIIKNNFIKYYKAYKDYLKSKISIGYNCFIMKKEYFNDLCNLEFGVISEFKNIYKFSKYSSKLQERILSYIGELMYGTYITYVKSTNAKILGLPIVYFDHTEKQKDITPFHLVNNIPIVLISSRYYLPYLITFLYSIIDNITDNNYYDIIILEKELESDEVKQVFKFIESKYKNVHISLFNPVNMIGQGNFYISGGFYAEEAYYRLFTPWILKKYDKAIVMDCDIIAKKDLAELYNIDVSNYLIAAARDYVYQGYLNGAVSDAYQYTTKVMGMHEPYNYINTGVLLMNLKKWRKEFSFDEVINFAQSKKFRIQEQDIINVLTEDNVLFLDLNWNFYTPSNPFVKQCIDYAPIHLIKNIRR